MPPNSIEPTRERLIQAAAELFATLGYARTTTLKIAAEAGVSEVTLFRHFGSKKNLFATVLEEYADTQDMRADLGSQFTGDYHQDMLTLGRHFMHALIERREAMRMMLCEAGHFEESARFWDGYLAVYATDWLPTCASRLPPATCRI